MTVDERADLAGDGASSDSGSSERAAGSMDAAAALMGTPVAVPKIPAGMSRADYQRSKPGRETQDVLKASGVRRRNQIIMIAVGVCLAAAASIALLMALHV